MENIDVLNNVIKVWLECGRHDSHAIGCVVLSKLTSLFIRSIPPVCRQIPRGDGDQQGGMGEGCSGRWQVFGRSPPSPHILPRASLQRVCQRRRRHEEFQRCTFTAHNICVKLSFIVQSFYRINLFLLSIII